jgi:serine phosphatase RsbU (regulator of sigma subunit)/uncharacterized protein YigA (DUF484 family)
MANQTEPKGNRGKTVTTKPARAKKAPAVHRQLIIQKALYDIADAASAVTDMQEFYAELHKIVGRLMYAKNFYVTLYDPTTQMISSPYFADEAGDVVPAPTRLDRLNRSLRGVVLLTGKTLHVSAEEIEEGRRRGRFTPMGTPAEDWIGVPLKVDGQVIGSLTVQSYEKGIRYGEQDVQLLEFVAQHIAVALRRARAIEETRQRNTELQVINRVQEGLASNLDIQSIYTLVGDELRDIFAADTTFIAFKDDAGNLLHVHYYADRVLRRSFRRPYRTGIAEVIIDSGHPLLIRNEQEQQEYGALHVVSPGAEKDLNQSVLGVPIFRDGKACGAVTVQSYKVNAFDENHLRLLQTLTNSMSVALENARLFNETQQRNAELAIINSVQEGLSSKLDMQAIYELVGEKIRTTFNAQVVNIVTYNRATRLMYGRYFFEDGEVLPGVTLPAFGFRKHVVETGQPIVINSDMPRWMAEYDNPVIQGLQSKSAIFIPLSVGKEVIGVISLQNNDQENAFTEADVRLLTTLANSMSVALENARLFDQTQQRNAELAVINSVQEGLASKLDMQSIYNLVGDKIREVFDAQGVTIAAYDPATDLLHYRYSIQEGERIEYDPMPLSDKGFRPYIVRTGQSLRLDDVETQGADYGAFMLQPANAPVASKPDAPKSWLGVPLLIGNEVRGVVNLYNVDRTHAYSDSDMRLLETLANSMSVALENARLWEQEKLYRKALERELEIGREIQAGFLPKTLPLVEGWEIAASLMSAREVAGDFYDVFELPQGTIGLVIADVCDKGVGAALFMTLFRSLIRITASQESYERTGSMNASFSTAERLQRAISLTNNYIAETHYESGMFATLFFGILDPRQGTLTYVNGGHEPPLIIQSAQVRESLCKTGPAVGALTDYHFDVGRVQLHPGEMLFTFTDGAVEAKDPRGEFFGRQRLLDISRQYSHSANEMVKALEAQLRQHIDGATQFDDITLLAARRVH